MTGKKQDFSENMKSDSMPNLRETYLSPSAFCSLFNLIESQCLDAMQTLLCLHQVLDDVMWEVAVKRVCNQINVSKVESLKRILQPNNGLFKSPGKVAADG